MGERRTVISDLICPECGNITSIPRKEFKKREKYHVKDFYCCRCKKITKHIELGNADIVKLELLYKNDLSELEKSLYNLLYSDNDIKKL